MNRTKAKINLTGELNFIRNGGCKVSGFIAWFPKTSGVEYCYTWQSILVEFALTAIGSMEQNTLYYFREFEISNLFWLCLVHN